MFGYLIIVGIFALVDGNKINVFHNNSVELSLNQILFFETPRFPMLWNSSIFLNYNTTVFTKDVNENGTRLVLILQGLAWNPSPFLNTADIYILNASSFHLQRYSYFYQYFDAFSGYVFFENFDNNCQFESLSRESPFEFTDETQIIFLQSGYHNVSSFGSVSTNPTQLNECIWQFTAPVGYGLKVVIQKFNISQSTKFRIVNSTDLLVNERSGRISHGYYNVDNYTKIELSKYGAWSSQDVEFSAYVTIVKNNVSKRNGNCFITENPGNFTWSSAANLKYGYPNNYFCSFNIVVNQGTTFLGTVDQLSIEKSIDYLIYSDGDYSFELSRGSQFLLQSSTNGSARNYVFEFESDGSFQASGFVISFLKDVCHCSDPIILCNSTAHTVMQDSIYDCSHLKCVFTIEPCFSPYTLLIIYAKNYSDIDYIKTFSNNILVFNTQDNKFDSNGEVYLSSENLNIIEVNSVSRVLKTATFNIEAFNSSEVPVSIVLTIDAPYYVLDQSVIPFAVIEVEESLILQNYSITVSGNNLRGCNKKFFYTEKLYKQINFNECELSDLLYKCHSKAKKIVYYWNPAIYSWKKLNGCYNTFTLTRNPKHCLFNSSIFFIQGNLSHVAMLSTDGECFLTILKESENIYTLSNIFTNNHTANVQIFVGARQKTLFLEFNSKTLTMWENIKIVSDVYTVKIPEHTTVQLTFTLNKLPFEEKIVNMPYQSLFSTVNYGRKQCSPYTPPFMVYAVGEVKIKFTVLDFQVNSIVYFETADRNFSVNHKGEVFVFENTKVSVYHGITLQEYCGCLFFVETIQSVPSY